MKRKLWKRPGSAALLMAVGACHGQPSGSDTAAYNAAAPAPVIRLATAPLVRLDTKGQYTLLTHAEIALTASEQQKGLSGRRTLGRNEAMVFPMTPPRDVSFWMKDTYVPLDILFLRTDHSIALIAPNTVPESRVPIAAGIPVAGVVELAGGRAAELMLQPGDRIVWTPCKAKAQEGETPLMGEANCFPLSVLGAR